MSHAVTLTVSDRQKGILERWVKSRAKMSARIIERSQIILMSAEGVSNIEQARRLGVDRQCVRRWRTRWAEQAQRLEAAELKGVTDKDLSVLLCDLLADEQRSGAPPTFGAEQLTQIISVACETPAETGRPVTHWTPRELADEVIKRGIVDTISPRHVDRLLKGGISVHTRRGTG